MKKGRRSGNGEIPVLSRNLERELRCPRRDSPNTEMCGRSGSVLGVSSCDSPTTRVTVPTGWRAREVTPDSICRRPRGL